MFSLCLRRTEEIYERLRIQRLYIKCNDKVGAMCQLVEGSFRGNEREFPTVCVGVTIWKTEIEALYKADL